jgi:hypothetical protein
VSNVRDGNAYNVPVMVILVKEVQYINIPLPPFSVMVITPVEVILAVVILLQLKNTCSPILRLDVVEMVKFAKLGQL